MKAVYLCSEIVEITSHQLVNIAFRDKEFTMGKGSTTTSQHFAISNT